MEKLVFLLMAFAGGVFLAIQGGLNAQLGVLLKNPFLATFVAFFFSATFALVFILTQLNHLPTKTDLVAIPNYLWFVGALFSVTGISLYYYTIPKLGVSTMISMGLTGQLIFAVIAGHFGWFNLPTEPISLLRIIGVISMIAGILFINLK